MLKTCKRCRKKFNGREARSLFCTEKCYSLSRKGKGHTEEQRERIRQSLLETYRRKRLGLEKEQKIIEYAERLDNEILDPRGHYDPDVTNLIGKRNLELVKKIKELKETGMNSRQVAQTLNVSLVRVNKLWLRTILIK